MAKRYSESDDGGCLSGFIRIFDFHLGHHSRKFLSDKKRVSNRALATGCSRKKLDVSSNFEINPKDVDVTSHKDIDKRRKKCDNSIELSVETLLEEEMSKTQNTQIQKNQLEQSQSESGPRVHLKEKNKNKRKKNNVVPNHHASDLKGSSISDIGQYHNPAERSYASYDLAALVVQFYCDSNLYQCQSDSEIDSFPLSESRAHRTKIHLDEADSQLSEKYSTLQKALSSVATAIQSSKLADSKEVAKNVPIQSPEFVEALEILSSKKELLVKLIEEDPCPPLLRDVISILNAIVRSENLGEEVGTSDKLLDASSNRLSQKESHHNFFMKKHKPRGSSQDISKTVPLKPNLARIQNEAIMRTLSNLPILHHRLKHQEEDESTKSYFSLKGIKRTLRHVIGENKKEKHPISMDRLFNRIPQRVKDSVDTRKSSVLRTKTSNNSQETSRSSADGKKKNRSSLKLQNSPCFIDQEDHRCLIGMEQVISLPEDSLLSPRFYSRSDKEHVLSPRKTIFPPSCQFNEKSVADSSDPLRRRLDQDAKTHVTESNEESIPNNLKPKGCTEVVEESDIRSWEQGNNLDPPPDQAVICEGHEKERSSELLEKEMSDDKLPLMIPSLSLAPNFSYIGKSETPDDTLQRPEKSSPVSVLEPFFLEDSSSPGSMMPDRVGLPLQAQTIDFQDYDDSAALLISSDFEDNVMPCFDEKEAIYDFITKLLQASGMTCYRILERLDAADQFLDPSLLEEAGILHTLSAGNSELLFDCVNEILAEIQERLFNLASWASIIKPNIQLGMTGLDLVEEVCYRIDKHLQVSQIPLDEIVSRYIGGRGWMDLWSEIEDVVSDMGDDILEGIIEEIMSE